MSVMSGMAAVARFAEIFRKQIDQGLDHVDGGSERHIWNGVVMDLPIVSDTDVARDFLAVDLDFVSGTNKYLVALVFCFANGSEAMAM